MSYNGAFPGLSEDIVFELAFLLSHEDLRNWLCVNKKIINDFLKFNGHSRYARTIFFSHFDAGSRLCNAEIKSSALLRLVQRLLRISKRMLVDKGTRNLYKAANVLLVSPNDISWDEFHHNFLRVEEEIVKQEILANNKWLGLELAMRLLSLVNERGIDSVLWSYLFRIICENLKSFCKEDNLPNNIKPLGDEWCEDVRCWGDDDLNRFHAYIVWFCSHISSLDNQKEIGELFEKIRPMLICNLGDFGIRIFREILKGIKKHQDSASESLHVRYPLPEPGKHEKGWVRLLKWYVCHPEELEATCDILSDTIYISYLLGEHVDARMLSVLLLENVGIDLLERYISNHEKLIKLCNHCSNNNVFVQSLFDIACHTGKSELLCEALFSDCRTMKNYVLKFGKMSLLLCKDQEGVLENFVLKKQMEKIGWYFFKKSGSFGYFLKEWHQKDPRLAGLVLDKFLLLSDSDCFMRYFMNQFCKSGGHKDMADYFCNTDTAFLLKIVNRFLNFSYELSGHDWSVFERSINKENLGLNGALKQRNLFAFLHYNLFEGDFLCRRIEMCVATHWSVVVRILLQGDQFCNLLADPQMLACFLIAIDPRLLPFAVKLIKSRPELECSYDKAMEIRGIKECLLKRSDVALQPSKYKIYNTVYDSLDVKISHYTFHCIARGNSLEEKKKKWLENNHDDNEFCVLRSLHHHNTVDNAPVFVCHKSEITKFDSVLEFYGEKYKSAFENCDRLNYYHRDKCLDQIHNNICAERSGAEPICTTEIIENFREELQKLVDEDQQKPALGKAM